MIITVTGKPGTGKTEFSRAIGLPVIDADGLGREILSEIKSELVEEFGDEILTDDTIDPEKLAKEAFADGRSVSRLNSISHPVLAERIMQKAEELEDVVIDAALYHELGLDELSDITILIECKKPRGGEKLLKRGAFQTPVKGADFTVRNDGTLDELKAKAREIWEKIRQQSFRDHSIR